MATSRAKRPVTIGVLTADPTKPGGVQSHAAIITRILQDWGANVEIVYTTDLAGSSWRVQETQHFDTLSYALPRFSVPFSWTVSPLIFGRQYLKRHDIHFAITGSSHIAFPFAVMGTPFIIWIASIWADELRPQGEAGDSHALQLLNSRFWRLLESQERFVLRRAQCVIANSSHTARRICEVVPEIADRVETIIIPVDTEFFQPDPVVRAFPCYGDYVMLTARLNDQRKNIPLALRAFALVHQQMSHLKFVITGGTPSDELVQLVHRLDLDNAVVFPGSVSIATLRRLYQGALLFLLSSHQEGLGIVLLEAMACGTPVVSTRSGGPDELLAQPAEVGRLTPKEDVEAFASAIIDLLSDRVRLEQMRFTCVDFVREHYSIQAASRQLFQIVRAEFPQVINRLIVSPTYDHA